MMSGYLLVGKASNLTLLLSGLYAFMFEKEPVNTDCHWCKSCHDYLKSFMFDLVHQVLVLQSAAVWLFIPVKVKAFLHQASLFRTRDHVLRALSKKTARPASLMGRDLPVGSKCPLGIAKPEYSRTPVTTVSCHGHVAVWFLWWPEQGIYYWRRWTLSTSIVDVRRDSMLLGMSVTVSYLNALLLTGTPHYVTTGMYLMFSRRSPWPFYVTTFVDTSQSPKDVSHFCEPHVNTCMFASVLLTVVFLCRTAVNTFHYLHSSSKATSLSTMS